jgi:hypothetical protein
VDEETQRRIGRNEVTFRKVNEALRSGRWPDTDREVGAFRCECAKLGCTRLVELSIAEYERIRSHPRWFFMAADHAIEDAERVVERRGPYIVVEKHGVAGRLAEATDPRTEEISGG